MNLGQSINNLGKEEVEKSSRRRCQTTNNDFAAGLLPSDFKTVDDDQITRFSLVVQNQLNIKVCCWTLVVVVLGIKPLIRRLRRSGPESQLDAVRRGSVKGVSSSTFS